MRSCICCIGVRKVEEQEGWEIGREQVIEEEEEEEQVKEQYIDKLIEKTMEVGKEKSKFTLELAERVTLGSAVSGWSTVVVLYGEVEKVLLDSKYKYLMSVTKTYAIIPKTDFVFLVYTSASDFGGRLEYHTTLYAFSRSTGWKSLDLD